MALPIALQLYSLREQAAANFPAVIRQVADMGYRGVEFAGFHGLAAAEVAKIVADTGMVSSSAHLPMATAENVQQIVDDAKTLGIGCVVSGGGPADFESADTVKALAEKFNAAADLLAPHGIKLGYHNHWWEFDHQIDDQCPHDLVMSLAPAMFAEVDVYWAKFGGDDPADVIRRNPGRVELLHIKDGDLVRNEQGRPANPHLAVGAGKVDMPAVVAAGVQAQAKWLIVELDSCATDMAEACAQSAKYMIENGLAEGR